MQTRRMCKSCWKSLNSCSIKSKLFGLGVPVFQNLPSPSFPMISLITVHYQHHHHLPQKGALQPNNKIKKTRSRHMTENTVKVMYFRPTCSSPQEKTKQNRPYRVRKEKILGPISPTLPGPPVLKAKSSNRSAVSKSHYISELLLNMMSKSSFILLKKSRSSNFLEVNIDFLRRYFYDCVVCMKQHLTSLFRWMI